MAASGVNVKMSVTGVADFKRKISDAKASVKTLDDALALCEAQLKATGDKETYMKDKADLLQRKLEKQKEIVDKAKKALKDMSDNGVDKSSTAFQKMQQECLKAETELTNTKAELDKVKSGGKDAGEKVKGMNQQLKQIGKGVSFENVTTGLKTVIDRLESGARAAVNFGKKVLSSAKGATGYADEIKTIVDQYSDMGLTAENYQRMKNVADIIDTPVEAILTARQRMNKALSTDSGKKSLEETLGIGLNGQTSEDLFWEIGDALMNMGEAFDKEEAAQKMFGRSWRDLLPLFKKGREEYEKQLQEQTVLTDAQIESLSQADDAIQKVEQQIEMLKNQFWADNADKITELMQWVVDNKEAVGAALTTIGGALGLLKLGEVALNFAKIVQGFKDLAGVADAAANTGAIAGNGFAVAFVKAFVAAAPVLATLLGITAVAVAPAMAANAEAANKVEQRTAAWKASASKLSGTDREFTEKSANALGLKKDENGNYVRNFLGERWIGGSEADIESILYGMANRSDLEKAKLYNLLNGSYTSQGMSTWSELQKLWSGEEMDMGRMTAILESVTDAYDKMAQATDDAAKATEKAAESSLTSEDMEDVRNMPKNVEKAVRDGMSGIVINLDGEQITRTVGARMGITLSGLVQ